jgi:AcrR family transcriptional regulator
VTISAVAQRAGLSRTSVYEYFRSSSDLVADLVKETQTALTLLEQEGGWWNACKTVTLQNRVKANRAKIQGALLDKTQVKVGANAYAAPAALSYNKPLPPFEEAAHELKPTRAAYLVAVSGANLGNTSAGSNTVSWQINFIALKVHLIASFVD